MPYTNVDVYKDIVLTNYIEMISATKKNRTPKGYGNDGFVIRYDPKQVAFKKSMIVIVFAGMWLEATFHQFMVSNFSKNQFHKHDKNSYNEKLSLMGIVDKNILNMASDFQKARNKLIHEKSYMDKGKIKFAQNEADVAHRIINHVLDST